MKGKQVLSFKYAFEGIVTALKDEPNLKIHFLIAVVVILLGLILGIKREEWILIVFLIGLVISVELTNTAIEETVDSFISELHPAAKKAKDVAAGAVLVVSVTAVVIGLIIFMPYLVKLFNLSY